MKSLFQKEKWRIYLSSDGEEDFPAGDAYPLSSRRLRAVWIRRIAESMELPEATWQMIEERLIRQQHQPQNIQVIIQGCHVFS